jgi:LysM repeat protein
VEYRYYYYSCANGHRWPYSERYCAICGAYTPKSSVQIKWTGVSPSQTGYSPFGDRYAFTLGLGDFGMWFFEFKGGLGSQTARDISSLEILRSAAGEIPYVNCTLLANDTLSGLAAWYYADASRYNEIAVFNGITDMGTLTPGQVLMIPNPLTTKARFGPRNAVPYVTEDGVSEEFAIYVVQRGDTLSDIAVVFLGDANRYMELAKLNELKNPRLLSIGQELLIPIEQK